MSEKKSNILSIVPKLEEKKGFTVKEALEEALKDVENHDVEGNAFNRATKILIVALDDSDNIYNTGFIQSGLRMSECISLVEVLKVRFMQHMGKLP